MVRARGRVADRPLTQAMSPLRLTWLNSIAASAIFSTRVRVHLLRWGGVDVRTAGVFPHVRFVTGHDVTIHDSAFVNVGVLFDAGAHIDLGPSVAVGPGVQFLTSSHSLGLPWARNGGGQTEVAPITVGEGSWIGAGAIILGGVTIGRGCVIGAGAVVSGDCKPNGLYVGVPAKHKRDLPEGPSEQDASWAWESTTDSSTERERAPFEREAEVQVRSLHSLPHESTDVRRGSRSQRSR
jgi:maltose O-acetyltransferase